MDKKYLVTISIPVYNMEKYLHRCLESIIVPEYFGQYEVLIINDGSKDSSIQIANEFQKDFPEVFKVIDKNNGNWGSCNNVAIEKAKGYYLRILDADDFFSIEDFRIFLKKISELKEDVDIIQTKCCIVRDNAEPIYETNVGIEYAHVYNVEDLVFNKNLRYAHHTATINLKLLRENNISLQEGMSYTDIELYSYSLRFAKTVIFWDILLYRYFLGRAGQSISLASYRKNICHLERLFKRMLECRYLYIADSNTNTLQSQIFYISKIFSVYCHLNIVDRHYADHIDHFEAFRNIWSGFESNLPELITAVCSYKLKGYKAIEMWAKFHITSKNGIGLCLYSLFRIMHMPYSFIKSRF